MPAPRRLYAIIDECNHRPSGEPVHTSSALSGSAKRQFFNSDVWIGCLMCASCLLIFLETYLGHDNMTLLSWFDREVVLPHTIASLIRGRIIVW